MLPDPCNCHHRFKRDTKTNAYFHWRHGSETDLIRIFHVQFRVTIWKHKMRFELVYFILFGLLMRILILPANRLCMLHFTCVISAAIKMFSKCCCFCKILFAFFRKTSFLPTLILVLLLINWLVTRTPYIVYCIGASVIFAINQFALKPENMLWRYQKMHCVFHYFWKKHFTRSSTGKTK